MVSGFLGIVGVVVGMLLSEGIRWWRELRGAEQLRSSLLYELDLNVRFIYQKADTITQMLTSLKDGKVMSGESVHFANAVYANNLPRFVSMLPSRELASLHVIYDHLNTVDSEMYAHHARILEVDATPKLEKVLQVQESRLRQILETLNLTERMILDHLRGMPADVAHSEVEHELLRKSFSFGQR